MSGGAVATVCVSLRQSVRRLGPQRTRGSTHGRTAAVAVPARPHHCWLRLPSPVRSRCCFLSLRSLLFHPQCSGALDHAAVQAAGALPP